MDITSVCERYFEKGAEGLQIAHLTGKASRTAELPGGAFCCTWGFSVEG